MLNDKMILAKLQPEQEEGVKVRPYWVMMKTDGSIVEIPEQIKAVLEHSDDWC